jgi:pimeloyl-ACP methyl ester carboxylesterase
MVILVTVLSLLLTAMAAMLFVLFFRVAGKIFDSDGMAIHYTDQGAGTPVVLVHGFAVQGDLNWRWTGCVRRLKERGYRVIVMDVRGHGRSGKPHGPESYGAALSDDIVRLMDHLGIDRAHIAGYSMGGFIVLKTIERHPDRLLSGVICAAGWGLLDEGKRDLFQKIVRDIETKQGFDPITHWLDKNKHASRLNCILANFFMRNINDLDAIVNVFRTFEALSVEEAALRRNAVPALTLVGERDGIREVSDLLPGVMANHELVHIPGGDHLTTILHPRFMAEMLRFLDRHSPPCSA